MISFLDLPNELILQIAENIHSESAISALSQASRCLHGLMFTCLCRYNAKQSRFSAVRIAVESRNVEALYRLLWEEKHMPPQIRRKYYWKKRPLKHPIFAAAQRGYDDILSALLDSGADMDCGVHGMFAPILAVEYRHLGILKMLLSPASVKYCEGGQYSTF